MVDRSIDLSCHSTHPRLEQPSLVVTDTGGYASLELQPNTSYEIAAPCMVMTVATSDVSGQAAQDMTTCALSRLWLPAVAR